MKSTLIGVKIFILVPNEIKIFFFTIVILWNKKKLDFSFFSS